MKLKEYLDTGKTYIIAEMSANHGGSLEKALEIVKYAKLAGADCLKIQTYTADSITINCHNEYFTVKGGLWADKNLYDLYKEAYTPWEWQGRIKEECAKFDLDFLSTPFDNTAVDFLESICVEAYKIASPELIDIPLIKYVAKKNKPILISCGMGNEEEIREALEVIKENSNETFVLLKCCSEYPTDYTNMNLRTISDMEKKFNCRVGLSDHSMGSLGAVIGVTEGAAVVEKHFCISRKDKTADSEFSMEYEEFKQMVEDIRNTEKILGKVSYEPSPGEVRGLRNRRSLFAVENIKKGEVFTEKNIRAIRPGQGIKPKYYEEILGKVATKDIEFGSPLEWDMIKQDYI